MQHACCNWCLSIVEVTDDYDRMQHKAYCSRHCLEKDWLFGQWQSDKNLGRLTDGQGEDEPPSE